MPRLIASDIDGTLLQNGELTIREEFFRLADRLIESGIAVCAASGRQYTSLRKLFAPIADRMYYICENGAVVYGNGKLLSRTGIERTQALALCHDIIRHPDCEVLISGTNRSYLCPKSVEYPRMIQQFTGNRITILSRPEDVPEEMVKISAYCPKGAAALEPVMRPKWEGCFQIAVAGNAWLDFNVCNKGDGLAALCRTLGISPKDAVAFGDNYNDCPMLDLAGTAYLMESAAQPLRQRYPRRCARVEDVMADILARICE